MTYARNVRAWHRRMNLDGMESRPCIPSDDSRHLGYRLVQEEHAEFLSALIALERHTHDGDGDPAALLGDVAKEGLDLVWVVLGLLLRYGIPVDECWSELCESNGSKTPGNRDEGGKLKKGPGYVAADMAGIVRKEMGE
jgi:predicted HAD superfamily Cof-like phosphohydrolase